MYVRYGDKNPTYVNLVGLRVCVEFSRSDHAELVEATLKCPEKISIGIGGGGRHCAILMEDARQC